jgi:hypothetical protein
MNEFNTWTRIVGSLSGERGACMEPQRAERRSRRPSRAAPSGDDGCSPVVALEMSEDCALIICWSDATRGRYADQRWVIGTSRVKGRCALSGCTIYRGDRVYRPRWRGGNCPVNSAEMILAWVVDDI